MRASIKGEFARFVAEKAVVPQLPFDSTPTRLSATGYGNEKSVDVYVRPLTDRSEQGGEMKYIPEVRVPANSSTAGVASTIKVADLFVEEFTRRPGSRVLLINADAVPTNKAAIRMLVSELQIPPAVIVLPSVCSSRTLSNGARGGFGYFPYGLYLRAAHGLDAVRCRDFHQHVDCVLRYAAPMMGSRFYSQKRSRIALNTSKRNTRRIMTTSGRIHLMEDRLTEGVPYETCGYLSPS